MSGSALLDVTVALLLAATLFWCVVLNSRLRRLSVKHKELQEAIAIFDQSTRRAEQTLERIEGAGLGLGRDMEALLARGQTLATDLSIMTAAGDKVANRLESAVDDVRALGKGRFQTGEAA